MEDRLVFGERRIDAGNDTGAAIAEQHRLVHLGCWAHCRRYFNDALQALPKDKRGPEQLPARFIELIGRLYKLEADARRDKLDAQALQQQRRLHSVPVLEQIEALALQHLHGVLPGSLLGKALHYLTAQWPKLVRYADDGRYPIDNNACENAIRPFVVGRRNAATGCSPTRRPAPTPAPTCTRCCRPAWPTGSMATGTSRCC